MMGLPFILVTLPWTILINGTLVVGLVEEDPLLRLHVFRTSIPYIFFFLWAYLKQLVYATLVPNVDILRDRILYGCHRIWNTVEIPVRQNMRRRIDAEAGHFQHLLRSTDMTSEGL